MIGPRDLNHNSMELVNGVTSGISLATAAALVVALISLVYGQWLL